MSTPVVPIISSYTQNTVQHPPTMCTSMHRSRKSRYAPAAPRNMNHERGLAQRSFTVLSSEDDHEDHDGNA